MRSWISLYLLFFSLSCVGQEVIFSEPLKLGNLKNEVEVLGFQNENILVQASSNRIDRKIFILEYNSTDLSLERQSELFLSYRKPVLEKLYVRRDTVYAYYSAYVENKLSLILSCYTDDFSTPYFSKVIAALSKRKFISDDVQLFFEHSTDWSHIVILKSKVANEEVIISEYFVLKNFQELVNSGLTQSNYNLKPAHFLVSNEGDVFLIYSEISYGFLVNKDLYSSFLVEHYQKDALRPKEFSISYDRKKISSHYFEIDNLNNSIIGAGFYAARKAHLVDGYFIYRYDYYIGKQKALEFKKFQDGSSTDLNRIVKTVFNNKVPNNLNVEGLILRRDGGAVLCGESVRVSENMSSRNTDLPGVSSQNYTYYNREILVLNISPEGDVDWAETINKDQISRDDDLKLSSYFLMTSTNALRFIFNESISKNANVRASDISYEGEKKSKIIFNVNEMKLKPMTRESFQLSAEELLIPSIGMDGPFFSARNSLVLVKIKF